jgi:AcrR family transcriptional regulator
VDPRLVLHFFGSKQELFTSVVELPFDPETAFDALLGPGRQGLGRRVAEFVLAILDSPEGRKTATGLIRATASEEEAAATIRELLARRLLLPLASRVGRDRPELRASLVASQIVGLAMARHVVGLTPLTTASHAELVAALAPVFEHYLTDPLDPT